MKLSYFLFLCASQKPKATIEDLQKIKSSLSPDILDLFRKDHSAIEEAALRSLARYTNRNWKTYTRILHIKTTVNKLRRETLYDCL